jgi:6-phosphogluconolactonase
LFYKKLAHHVDDWRDTTFILSDERMVDENSKLSNSYHIKENLLKYIKDNELPDFLSFSNLIGSEQIGITSYINDEKLIKLGNPEIAVLGLGADGHTASLFPGNQDLYNNDDKSCIIVKNNYENYYRISLTFNYLLRSKKIVFLISGEAKSKVLKQCIGGPYEPVKRPAQYLFKNYGNKITIFCDEAAAKEI